MAKHTKKKKEEIFGVANLIWEWFVRKAILRRGRQVLVRWRWRRRSRRWRRMRMRGAEVGTRMTRIRLNVAWLKEGKGKDNINGSLRSNSVLCAILKEAFDSWFSEISGFCFWYLFKDFQKCIINGQFDTLIATKWCTIHRKSREKRGVKTCKSGEKRK